MSEEVLLDLGFLTEEERQLISKVISKDVEIRKQEQSRISFLRKELDHLKEDGLPEDEIEAKNERYCARCQTYFGLVWNKGALCPRCDLRVCKVCRVSTVEDGWICTLCYKVREVKAQSGAWFFQDHKEKGGNLFGSMLVRKSLRRLPGSQSGLGEEKQRKTQPLSYIMAQQYKPDTDYAERNHVGHTDKFERMTDQNSYHMKTNGETEKYVEYSDASEEESDEGSHDGSRGECRSTGTESERSHSKGGSDSSESSESDHEELATRELYRYPPGTTRVTVDMAREGDNDVALTPSASEDFEGELGTRQYTKDQSFSYTPAPRFDIPNKRRQFSDSDESSFALHGSKHVITSRRSDAGPLETEGQSREFEKESRELKDRSRGLKEGSREVEPCVISQGSEPSEYGGNSASVALIEGAGSDVELDQEATEESVMEVFEETTVSEMRPPTPSFRSLGVARGSPESVTDLPTQRALYGEGEAYQEDESDTHVEKTSGQNDVMKSTFAQQISKDTYVVGSLPVGDHKQREVHVSGDEDEQSEVPSVLARVKNWERMSTGEGSKLASGRFSSSSENVDRAAVPSTGEDELEEQVKADLTDESGSVGVSKGVSDDQDFSAEERDIKETEVDDIGSEVKVDVEIETGKDAHNVATGESVTLDKSDDTVVLTENAHDEQSPSGDELASADTEVKISERESRADLDSISDDSRVSVPTIADHSLETTPGGINLEFEGQKRDEKEDVIQGDLVVDDAAGVTGHDVTRAEVTRVGVSQDDVSQHDILRGDVSRDDVPRDDGSEDDISPDHVSRDNVLREDVPPPQHDLLRNGDTQDDSKSNELSQNKDPQHDVDQYNIAQDVQSTAESQLPLESDERSLLAQVVSESVHVGERSLEPDQQGEKNSEHKLRSNRIEFGGNSSSLTEDTGKAASSSLPSDTFVDFESPSEPQEEEEERPGDESATLKADVDKAMPEDQSNVSAGPEEGAVEVQPGSPDVPETPQYPSEDVPGVYVDVSQEPETTERDHDVGSRGPSNPEVSPTVEEPMDSRESALREFSQSFASLQSRPASEISRGDGDERRSSDPRGTFVADNESVVSETSGYVTPTASEDTSSKRTPSISGDEGASSQREEYRAHVKEQTPIIVTPEAENEKVQDEKAGGGQTFRPSSILEFEEDLDVSFSKYGSSLGKWKLKDQLSMGSRESIASYYSNAGGEVYGKYPVTGEIYFGIRYDAKDQEFQVQVHQARDITAVDEKNKVSDPYVKTYLLPDRSRSGKRKTKVKKNTINPVFDEILTYKISYDEILQRTLWLAVWNYDRFGHNDFLGEVLIPIDEYHQSGFSLQDPEPQWYDLCERQADDPNLSYHGEIVVALKYVPPSALVSKKKKKKKKGDEKGELHINIIEANNLIAKDSNGYSDPFCKSYLLPDKSKKTKQKTSVVKKTLNPKWNHHFVYDNVTHEELLDRVLELTVWDFDRGSSNEFLGGVRLGLGAGLQEWDDANSEEQAAWNKVLNNQNDWNQVTLTLRDHMGNHK